MAATMIIATIAIAATAIVVAKIAIANACIVIMRVDAPTPISIRIRGI